MNIWAIWAKYYEQQVDNFLRLSVLIEQALNQASHQNTANYSVASASMDNYCQQQIYLLFQMGQVLEQEDLLAHTPLLFRELICFLKQNSDYLKQDGTKIAKDTSKQFTENWFATCQASQNHTQAFWHEVQQYLKAFYGEKPKRMEL